MELIARDKHFNLLCTMLIQFISHLREVSPDLNTFSMIKTSESLVVLWMIFDQKRRENSS